MFSFLRSRPDASLMLVIVVWTTGMMWYATDTRAAGVVDLGDGRELFIDRHLIARMRNLDLRLQTPQPAPISVAPPPRSSVYSTIIEDDGVYHLYYRANLPKPGETGEHLYAYYYMTSEDGLNWEKPDLGLFPQYGAAHRNMILAPDDPITHNFSPFLDTRPDAPREQRFKALGGGGKTWSKGEGLYALVSEDGIHWQKLQDDPVIPEGKDSEHYFDSQNVAFWSESEGRYICYYRTWLPKVPGRRGIRSISRSTSPDFINWSEQIQYAVNEPDEQLYTNQTSPYFRAPHIYIAMPLRFLPWSGGDIHRYPSDVVLMSARGAKGYKRTFKEAFIRPGRKEYKWQWPNPVSTSPTLGIIQTAEDEMSIYVRDQRYVLRLDGFASLHAGAEFGEMITKPLRFKGDSLEINFATSAAGRIYIEVQDIEGRPIPGFTLDDTPVIVGDQITHTVKWKDGRDLGALADQPIRLRFKMRDADLYAIRFK